jgi:hypothetical protein
MTFVQWKNCRGAPNVNSVPGEFWYRECLAFGRSGLAARNSRTAGGRETQRGLIFLFALNLQLRNIHKAMRLGATGT